MPTAPLSKRTTTTAVSSRPRSFHSGSTRRSRWRTPRPRSRPGSGSAGRRSRGSASRGRSCSARPGPGRTARVAGHRPQQSWGAQAAVVEQGAGRGPVRRVPAVEPDLQDNAGGAGGIDGPVGVGKGQRPSASRRTRPCPAAAAATTRSAWNLAGAAITTASISGSANTSAGSVANFAAPSEAASCSAAPGAGSATAASSRPATAARASRRGTNPSAPIRSVRPGPDPAAVRRSCCFSSRVRASCVQLCSPRHHRPGGLQSGEGDRYWSHVRSAV